MLFKESAYRLPAALLVLMALVASVPLMASAEEEGSEYSFLSIDIDVDGGEVTISGEVEGDNLSTLKVHFEDGVISGSTAVGSNGLFSFTTSAVTGSTDAVLREGATPPAVGDELAREQFFTYE